MTTMAGSGTQVVRSEDQPRKMGWLMSPWADFWLATSGGSLTLLLLLAVLHFRGWRELDVADLLLAELHLGATFDAVVRRRLWRTLPWDVLVIPSIILVATYALMLNGNRIVITTILAYLSVWHRGRQDLGLGRWYQRAAGGAVSKTHNVLFNAAIYLPMAASVLFYTGSYPTHYEGFPYHALVAPLSAIWALGLIAGAAVLVYLIWSIGKKGLHPAERWLVLSHTVAFGSAYLLGAWNLSFIIVIAIHHEIQYLYFAYAVARRQVQPPPSGLRSEARLFGTFAIWPALGLAITLMANATGVSDTAWFGPSFAGLLLVHYWLDGRIWTRRAAAKPKTQPTN